MTPKTPIQTILGEPVRRAPAGVLFLCTGRRGDLLRNCIGSLKETNPALPVHLLADQPYDVPFQWVRSWIDKASRRIKTQLYQYTPYDVTLFADDDTVFAKPIEVREMLGDSDIAMALDVLPDLESASRMVEWPNHVSPREIEETISMCGKKNPFYNSGVMVWRNDSPAVRELFDRWWRECHQDNRAVAHQETGAGAVPPVRTAVRRTAARRVPQAQAAVLPVQAVVPARAAAPRAAAPVRVVVRVLGVALAPAAPDPAVVPVPVAAPVQEAAPARAVVPVVALAQAMAPLLAAALAREAARVQGVVAVLVRGVSPSRRANPNREASRPVPARIPAEASPIHLRQAAPHVRVRPGESTQEPQLNIHKRPLLVSKPKSPRVTVSSAVKERPKSKRPNQHGQKRPSFGSYSAIATGVERRVVPSCRVVVTAPTTLRSAFSRVRCCTRFATKASSVSSKLASLGDHRWPSQ